METPELSPSQPSPPAVQVTDISKRFSGTKHRLTNNPGRLFESFVKGTRWETQALDRVSFSVDHGEIFGLLGPNGSGKTTLIKILSNLVLPDSGSAFVEGINVARRPYAAAERIQTVLSESMGLEKRLSLRDNLMLFAALYELPKSEASDRIDHLLEFFGLAGVAYKSTQTLSTGMSRKVSVCRVLLSRASVIVFDEPTSGLDPRSADDFRRLIMEDLVKREKKTIIMATHNLVEATSMCTHIALLNKGRLLTKGTPEEIRRTVEDRTDVVITLGGSEVSAGDLAGELQRVDGIQSASIVGAQGTSQVRLTGRRDMDYLKVLSLVSAQGLKVISLETSSPSLEDAFLKLIQEAKR